jgi:hypothetical protein
MPTLVLTTYVASAPHDVTRRLDVLALPADAPAGTRVLADPAAPGGVLTRVRVLVPWDAEPTSTLVAGRLFHQISELLHAA